MGVTIVLFLVALLTYLAYRHYVANRDFPPGHPRLPVLGCMLSTRGASGARMIMEATKTIPMFGSIIGLVLGSVRMVIVCDFNLAKELFQGDRLAGRVTSHYLENHRGYEGKCRGIITTEGENWRTQRRFALATLKEFGFGKTSMGVIISDEADEVMSTLAKQNDVDIRVDQLFNIPVFNILWRIVGGKRFKHDDPFIREVQSNMAEYFKHAFKDKLFPWLSYLFPSVFHVTTKIKHVGYTKAIFEKTIKEHQETLDNQTEPRDLIDVYLREMKTNPALNVYDLVGMCMDFFEAGGETVGSTLAWLMMYLVTNQEVQEKCHQEIREKVGDRDPVLEDKSLLPYCEATIMEVQRISCVAVASLNHRPMEETDIKEYKIPNNTYVYYNIYHFHTDPTYWNEPEVFIPERFLEESPEGTLKVVKPDRFVPFGFGKRVCMGESLAKAELFLFATIMIQKLQILPPTDHSKPDPSEDIAGLTRCPKPFYVRIQARE